MPPKTKRETRTVDGGPGGSKKQVRTEDAANLEEQLVHLLEELDKERQEKSFFQLERNQMQASWEISKRSLEEAESELRRKGREREEAEERHLVEIKVYKQKLKVLLSEQKKDGVSSSSPVQNHLTDPEVVPDVGGLRGDDSRQKKHVEDLDLKHQVELMELSNAYERRLRELEVSFHRRLQSVTEEEQKQRWAAVREVERLMRTREASLAANHDRALRKAEEYHSSAESRLQDELRTLKEELQEEKKQRKRMNEELSAAQQENKRLTEGLHEDRQKIIKLQRRLQKEQQEKDDVTKRCASLKMEEKELRELKEDHQLLLEAFHKVQLERDELLRTQTQMIVEVQQRNELKETMLQRKLAELTVTLEQKEAQLQSGQPAATNDPGARSHAHNELVQV